MQASHIHSEVFYNEKGGIDRVDFGLAFSFSHENGIRRLLGRLFASHDGKINAVDQVYYAEEESQYCVLFCGLPRTDTAYPYNVLNKVEVRKAEVVASLSQDLSYTAWSESEFMIVLPYVQREALVNLRENMKYGKVSIFYDSDIGLSLVVETEEEEDGEYIVTFTSTWQTQVSAKTKVKAEEKAHEIFDPAYLKDNIKVTVN